jgi:hypothetical protein
MPALVLIFLLAIVLFCPIGDPRDPDAVRSHYEDHNDATAARS